MRRLLLSASLALAATIAAAQVPATPAPKTTLEFDQQQLQWLGEAILNLPKKVADPLLADLNRQIAEQQRAAADAARAKAEAAKAPDTPK